MESLLANYGSDDEEDEPQQQHQRPTCLPAFNVQEEEEEPQQQHQRPPISAFLPPPKIQIDRSSEIPARRSSLFASLPRPKSASQDAWKSDVKDAEYRDEMNVLDTTSIAERSSTATEDEIRVVVVADGVSDVRKQCSHALSASSTAFFSERTSSASSLFRALPPPKIPESSTVPVTSQRPSGPSKKRVVELRPSINMALLQEPDDDDDNDAKLPMKRHASEGMAGGKLTGLAAILPKPKNLVTALGSGSASGHQTTLDVGTSATSPPSTSESTLGSGYGSGHQHINLNGGDSGRSGALSSVPHSIDESPQMLYQHASESWSSYDNHGGNHGSTFGPWDGHDLGANLQVQPEVHPLNASSAPYLSTTAQEGAEAYYSENNYDYSQEMVQDPLAEMFMREKRKGGRNAPVNIIEVKQEDLTATKVREDQLRTTGIAFGPAYKPMSTSKSKPSKLHRRKHQIGSLFYDMKQKETELMERRAKGYMTKAETQAKYGW